MDCTSGRHNVPPSKQPEVDSCGQGSRTRRLPMVSLDPWSLGWCHYGEVGDDLGQRAIDGS